VTVRIRKGSFSKPTQVKKGMIRDLSGGAHDDNRSITPCNMVPNVKRG